MKSGLRSHETGPRDQWLPGTLQAMVGHVRCPRPARVDDSLVAKQYLRARIGTRLKANALQIQSVEITAETADEIFEINFAGAAKAVA